jgi:Vacuole effluxer Atg22 like
MQRCKVNFVNSWILGNRPFDAVGLWNAQSFQSPSHTEEAWSLVLLHVNASICFPGIEHMASNNSRLELGDSVHEALLSPDGSHPAEQYERETQAALRRKEQQLDANSHRRKLFGWLSYAFARYGTVVQRSQTLNLTTLLYSEVFAVCSLTLFLPICLEVCFLSFQAFAISGRLTEAFPPIQQFARDNGYLLPDRTVRCVIAGDVDSFAPSSPSEEARCVVKIGWLWVDTASFSLYVYSLSVLLQALTVISMGGIADRRKFVPMMSSDYDSPIAH